jgi:putative ABC transport system permease protein
MHEPHDWRSDVRARLSGTRLSPADEADLVEEVAQHLEQQFADLAPRVGPTAAREQLLAQLRDEAFDGAAMRRRRRADARGSRVWHSSSVLRDVRYGLRSLRRSPGTLIAGTMALALGIGLTTAMFSIIYGLLIKGLPFDEPSRIAVVKYIDPLLPGVDALIPLGDYAAFRNEQHPFETFAAYAATTANISGGDRPDRVSAARVTPGTLDATRVPPALGRTFSSSDAASNGPATVVLSHAVWRDRFAANPAVLGRTIRVDGQPHTIIGVMPPDFAFPQDTRLWLPLRDSATKLSPGQGPMVTVIGRLRDGESYAAANAEFRGLAQRFAAARATADTNMRIVVLPFVRASVNPRFYNIMGIMFTVVVLVLLVACANVANLLLDRAANRAREIGIRTALGASRLAILRQSLVESVLLAALGALFGTALAQVGIVIFNRVVASSATRPLFWMDVRLHPVVLGFVVIVAMVASIVSGLLPAAQSARLDITAVLKDESNAASSLSVGRLSRAIVVAEIALSSAILLASGFFTRSLVNLRNIDPGFETRGIVTARVTLSTPDSIRRRAFFQSLHRDLAALPGSSAYLGDGLPGSGWTPHHLSLEGATYGSDRERPVVRTLGITPEFFSTFGVHVVRGRAIGAADDAGAPGVAVVSESFVRRAMKGADPMGKRIRVGSDSTAPWLTIVGVAPTLFSSSFEDPWPAEVLTSFWQQGAGSGMTSATIAMRGENATTAATLRRVVASLDPDVPVYATQSMADVTNGDLWGFHLFGTILIVFGVVALLLSSIGLYAVMTFSVGRRVREMGIRLALGATGGDVARLVARQGAGQTVAGMGIGFVFGAAFVQVARSVLFGVRPGDPFVILLVAGVLGGTAAIACIIPARRATRVDPVVALRVD